MHAAVLGKPVEHSLSPVLHQAAYRVLGLDWTFDKIIVDVDQMKSFLTNVDRELAGYAVTMPLKDVAFECAKTVDEYAQQTRAVNTLIPSGDGWEGFNTDVIGFVTSLQRAGLTQVQNPVVIGAGATARSAAAALGKLGATSLTVIARRESAIAEMQSLFPAISITGIPFAHDAISGDVVISTLPAGSADLLELSPDVSLFYDVIYAPWPTKIARLAQSHSILTLGGLDLLVGQGIEQVLLMTQCGDEYRGVLFDAMMSAGLAVQEQRSRAD